MHGCDMTTTTKVFGPLAAGVPKRPLISLMPGAGPDVIGYMSGVMACYREVFHIIQLMY